MELLRDICVTFVIVAVWANGLNMSEGVKCTDEEEALCRTDVPGNNCTHDPMFRQHICSCDFNTGFALHLQADWSGYTHRCVRSDCNTQEKTYCLTDFGNGCKVVAGNEAQCICKHGYASTDDSGKQEHGCLRKNCASPEKSRKCLTHLNDNRCHDDFGEDYHCTCHEPGHEVTKDGKECYNTRCVDPRDRIGCRTLYNGNSCRMVDGIYRQCTCNAERFQVRMDVDTNNTECWLKGCSSRQKELCDPYGDGNECDIFDGIYYKCKCDAPGSIVLPEYGLRRCFSTLCKSRADIYACKSDLDGNDCSLLNATTRKCSCGAPGYEVDSLTEDTCWRMKCVSYEEEQCHTEAEGNACAVLADVHTCECNATGFEAEPSTVYPQRCIKTVKHTKQIRTKQRVHQTRRHNNTSSKTTASTPFDPEIQDVSSEISVSQKKNKHARRPNTIFKKRTKELLQI